MTSDDLGALDAMCASRNVHRREYERFIGLEGAHGLVAAVEGHVIGAVTAMRYFEHAFLGPVLTHADQDAVGVSLALVAGAVEGLQRSGATIIEAQATRDEAVVLGNLGFEAVGHTVVMERAAAALAAHDGTRAMREDDLLDVGALDADAAGFGRKEYLAWLRREHPDGARVVERDGEVAGYALARRSRRGWHLGPLVTRGADAEAAASLARAVVAPVASWPVVALASDDDAAALLRGVGFERVGGLVRMRAGERPPMDGAVRQWALGGRMTG